MGFILFFGHLVKGYFIYFYLLNSLEICTSSSTVSQKSKSLRLCLQLDFFLSFIPALWMNSWLFDSFIWFVYLSLRWMILLRDLFCLIASVGLRQWTRMHGGGANEVQWGVTLKWFITPAGSAAVVCPKSPMKGAFLFSMALLRIDAWLLSWSHLFCFRCTHTHAYAHIHSCTSNGKWCPAVVKRDLMTRLLAALLLFIHNLALGVVHPQCQLLYCVSLVYFWPPWSLQWQRLNTAAERWHSNYALYFVFQLFHASLSLFHQPKVVFQGQTCNRSPLLSLALPLFPLLLFVCFPVI